MDDPELPWKEFTKEVPTLEAMVAKVGDVVSEWGCEISLLLVTREFFYSKEGGEKGEEHG